MMDIDDLRNLCSPRVADMTDDEAVLDFYCWQDARLHVEAWQDDKPAAVTQLIKSWFVKGLKPATIAEVKTWLDDFFDEDAMAGTDADMRKLIDDWRLAK